MLEKSACLLKSGASILFSILWLEFTCSHCGRYFFHATESRQLEDDYWLQDSDADDAIDTSTGDPLQEGSTEPEESGHHNEWLDVPEIQESTQATGDSREVPEEDTIDNDSDNLDIQDDDTELSDTDGLNEKASLHHDVTQHPVIFALQCYSLKRLFTLECISHSRTSVRPRCTSGRVSM